MLGPYMITEHTSTIRMIWNALILSWFTPSLRLMSSPGLGRPRAFRDHQTAEDFYTVITSRVYVMHEMMNPSDSRTGDPVFHGLKL